MRDLEVTSIKDEARGAYDSIKKNLRIVWYLFALLVGYFRVSRVKMVEAGCLTQ